MLNGVKEEQLWAQKHFPEALMTPRGNQLPSKTIHLYILWPSREKLLYNRRHINFKATEQTEFEENSSEGWPYKRLH